jgi:hypothetical protein
MSTNLYLGNELIIHESDVLFNNASVTVKAPTLDLNVTNKIYVDSADIVLDGKITSEAATRLAEDKKLLAATSRSMIVPLTTAICGGQAQPAIMPSAISETGYDGWYYKKVANDSVNNKINWYLAPDVSMKVSDLHQLFFELSLINVTSTPFITVYTKRDNITPNGASWYKSRRTFELLDKSGLIPGNYCCYMKFNSESPNPVSYGHSIRQLAFSDVVSNIVGSFASGEEILFFSFGTDSSAAIGNVEFICKTVCVQSAKGTQNFLFSNIHVEAKAVATQLNNLYQYFLNQNRDGPVPTRG